MCTMTTTFNIVSRIFCQLFAIFALHAHGMFQLLYYGPWNTSFAVSDTVTVNAALNLLQQSTLILLQFFISVIFV